MENPVIGIRHRWTTRMKCWFQLEQVVFIHPGLNVGMVGPKTDIDIDNRHVPKSGELLCPNGKRHSSAHFLAHVYCGLMVAHLSSC